MGHRQLLPIAGYNVSRVTSLRYDQARPILLGGGRFGNQVKELGGEIAAHLPGFGCHGHRDLLCHVCLTADRHDAADRL